MDNMRWSSSSVWKKQIYFGVRGDTIDLTVYASKDPYTVDIMETGHQSCNDASAIISFNEDDDGRVTIKGFYDDVFH
jgi:hypothetical protein